MTWTRALLIASLAASAAALSKPATKDILVPALTEKLEHVMSGLESIYESQSKKPEGPSKFAQILKTFLTDMKGTLNDVKTNTKLTEAQKLEKLRNVEASVQGLKEDMVKRSTDLKMQGEEEKDSLLMGVLMSRKNRPEAEQMEVLSSPDFKDLEVVKYVLAHRDTKKSLIEQVATYLDKKSRAHVGAAKDNLKQATNEVVGMLDAQLQKMEKNMADQEALHKKMDAELEESLKKEEAKMANLKGKDKDLKDEKAIAEKKKASRAVKVVKRMEKKEDRDYAKTHALMLHDVSTMKNAIESVKKGDVTALSKAQQALQHSMQAMQASQGEFLHFLQLGEWMATEKSSKGCPYCKAQCLEKCHNDGHSFMECMGSCDSVGN